MITFLESVLLHDREIPDDAHFVEIMEALDYIRFYWKDEMEYERARTNVKKWLLDHMDEKVLRSIYAFAMRYKYMGFSIKTFDEFKRYDAAREYWIDYFIDTKLKKKTGPAWAIYDAIDDNRKKLH